MLKSLSKTMLATCVLVTGYTASPLVREAGANQVQLHELLFNRKKRQEFREKRQKRSGTAVRQKPRATTPRRAAAPSRPAIRRVAGPQYYTYKAAALKTVTVASILPDLETTGSVMSVAAQSTQTELPPMVMLDGSPRFDSVTEETPTTFLVDQSSGDTDLPSMMVLEPVAPPIVAETQGPRTLEAAPIRLPSAEYFSIAVQEAPDSQIRVESEIESAIRALYAARQDFLWSDGVDVTKAGQALVAMLANAGQHGLRAEDYAVDLPVLGTDANTRAQQLIEFDVTLTARAIRYARDIKDGVVDANKLSGYHDFKGERLAADVAANALADSAAPTQWLESLAPRQREYAALQEELATLQNSVDDSIVLPAKIFLKPGTPSDVLPLVIKAMDREMRDETRQKHAATLSAYDGSTAYDGALVELVRDVQRDLGLSPDGIVGPKTAARLGGNSVQSRIDKVVMAMERLRWHPEDYADRHVVINAPEYRVRYLEDGQTALAMNVIVGKKTNQTYFFHDEIEHVVYNPYWGVPQSIIVNSYLPKLHRDPSYLDRNGFVVTTHGGQQISSSAINWRQYSGKVPFNVRQRPGPSNALGELKIMFPNKHAIYMHDTPAKDLFARDSRAYSSGCVRLEDPRAMAAAVLGKSRGHVSSQIGGYEQTEKLGERVPVYVGYFTAWLNDDGKIAYHPDVYERDAHLGKAMKAIASARG